MMERGFFRDTDDTVFKFIFMQFRYYDFYTACTCQLPSTREISDNVGDEQAS